MRYFTQEEGAAMDPYRILFPIGVIAAVLGTCLWIAFGFGAISTYPGASHPDLMIGGFLSAFASGFLMTAIPRFTKSFFCRPFELGFITLLFVALISVSFLETRAYFHLISGFIFVFLIFFAARRFLSRGQSPPRFFVFVGLGLLMGVAGACSLFASDRGWITGEISLLGRLVYTQGAILSLTLGVGTHLLPALFGWAPLPTEIKPQGNRSRWLILFPVIALALALVVSFWLEAGTAATAGRILKSTLVTILALRYWKIWKRPKTKGTLTFWLWISAWSLVLGLWASALFPAYGIHGLHLAFIGGFGLMVFMVATRVTLAHGGYGNRLENKSKALAAAAIFIILAALTRVLAISMPSTYLHHLAYAAICWNVGVVTWAIVFIPKIIWIKDQEN